MFWVSYTKIGIKNRFKKLEEEIKNSNKISFDGISHSVDEMWDVYNKACDFKDGNIEKDEVIDYIKERFAVLSEETRTRKYTMTKEEHKIRMNNLRLIMKWVKK